MIRNHFIYLFSAILLLLLTPYSPTAQDGPSEAYIRSILQERVEKDRKSVGIVVGIVSDEGVRIISYGKPDQQGSRSLDGETVFEIGSITKVFTTILLADMAARGEVNLTDPAAKYLPKSIKVPTRNNKEITLLDLATHTSGLPRVPTNLAPKDERQQYAEYTVEQLYDFLSNYRLTRDIGEEYEYSNLGMGLLGHILALKAGMDYETLVITRICEALGMKSTRIKLSTQMQARLATGHDKTGKAMLNWDFPAMPGTGALRSTTTDMLKFVAANLGLMKTGLLSAMQKTHREQTSIGLPNRSIALGWQVLTEHGAEIVWHDGVTGGYQCFIGFDQKKRRGVVVLSNSTNGIDDIGLHLLESAHELTSYKPRKGRRVIKLDPKIYDGYVGKYELNPEFVMTVTRDGDKFYVEATGQGKAEIVAESETKFYTEADTRFTFLKDEKGRVTYLILRLEEQDIFLKRIK
jgi:D-alanyl-D-alanine-carboxypeptidase/D-alanyl-D-alanine-endopeptidase